MTASTSSIATTAERPMTPGARKAIAASVIGTLIEWYDYALYGAAAGLIIGPLFFPDTIPVAAGLSAFATFAVGFIVRPVGGIVIGHIGDKHGRKPAMILTIVLMAAATVGIGLLPTAAALGALAPILLVLLRFIQGFGAGAELSGAMTLVAEYAPPRKRGFYTSLVLSTPPAGIVLATGAFLWVSQLPDEAFLGYGWRLPFFASAVLFFVALFIRSQLEESPEYLAAQEAQRNRAREAKAPIGQLLRKDWKPVVIGFMSITGHNALNYLMAAFSIFYLTSPDVGMDRSDALLAVTLGSICGIVTTPVGGWLADKLGAGTVLGGASVIGAVFAFPFMMMLEAGTFAMATVAIAIGYGVIIAGTSGAQGAFLTNLFPAEHRFSGVALAREANGALIAGFSPMIALALIGWAGGEVWSAALYLMLCCVLGVVAVMWARGRGDNEHARGAV